MYDLDSIRKIPVLEVAKRLGIKILGGNKAYCFGGHDKLTPSLSFSASKNIWKCFGCERKGNVIGLVEQYNKCDFLSAVDWLSNNFNLRITNTDKRKTFMKARREPQVCNSLVYKKTKTTILSEMRYEPDPEIYNWLLKNINPIKNSIGQEYLKNHGISDKTVEIFGIREIIDPQKTFNEMKRIWGAERIFHCGLINRKNNFPDSFIWKSYTLIFPFFINSSVFYLQGRQFRREPKFLNPTGISKQIYNVNRIDTLSPGSVIHICEGIPDTLAMEEYGFPAVGILGASSFKKEWVDLFINLDVVLMPDGDKGGQTFFKIITKEFNERGKTLRTVIIPEGKDVSDLISTWK